MAENYPSNNMSRRASYKATMDYQERKSQRAETTLQIGKQKKGQNVWNRRLKKVDGPSFPVTVLPGIGKRKCTMQDVPALSSFLCSGAPLTIKVEATKQLRRLSNDENHRMQMDDATLRHLALNTRIDVGKFDEGHPEWQLVLESSWVLGNLLSVGNNKQPVVDAGIIGSLAVLLKDQRPSMCSTAALCLGNIVSDSVALRDQVLGHNVMRQLYVSDVDCHIP